MFARSFLSWLVFPRFCLCKQWDQFPTHEIAPGVYLPDIMIGTWVIGADDSKGDPEDSGAIVRNWLEIGGRGVDTAIYYQDQSLVAEAVAEVGVKRKNMFIETKVDGCFGSADVVRSKVKFCLDQLSTDYIDLMLIHMPSGTPQDCINTWKVLEHYHEEGVLRAIGVSNFYVDDLNSLLPAATIVPAVNQLPFNVFFHDDELIEFCKNLNITVQAWSPLGSPGRSARSEELGGQRSIFRDATLASIAARHRVSAPQVAIRWVLQRVPTLVFESSSKAHQATDADVYGFTLSDEEVAVIDNLQHNSLSFLGHGRTSPSYLPLLVAPLFFVAVFAASRTCISQLPRLRARVEGKAGGDLPHAVDVGYESLSAF